MAIIPHALLLSGLVSATPAAAPRGLPQPVVPDPFGVNIHFVVPDEKEADTLAAGGFRFIRMDFHWSSMEKEKGKYDFSGYDKLIDGLSRRGIRALFILDYGNPLYDKGDSPRTDEGRAAFAAWAGAAAKHFAGKGILWEIWNEPNISFWKPTPNVEDYCKLSLATIKAVRAADPEAFIIGPASSTFPWDYFTVMGERGVIAQLDAFSVHPYRQTNPETVQADYRRLRALLDRYSPNRHLPIVSGEWGYSTAWGGLTEEKQSQYIVRQWLTNLSNNVGPSIWYDWRDDGLDPKEPEHHFGSVYREFSKPKPSYLAAQTLCNTLRGYRFVRRADVGSENDYVLVLRKGDDVALAAWTTGDAHTLRLPVPVAPAKTVGMLGEARTPAYAGEGLSLELSGSPQYVLLSGAEATKLAFWGPVEPVLTVRAGKAASLAVRVENPLAGPYKGSVVVRAGESVLGTAAVSLKVGAQAVVNVPLGSVGRDREMVPAQVEIATQQASLSRTPVWLMLANPLPLTVLPVLGHDVTVRIENPSGEAVTAKLQASAGAVKATTTAKLAAGQKETLVSLRLPAAPAAGVPVTVEGFDAAGARLWPATPSTWRPVLPIKPGAVWGTHLEGDAKVAGTAQVAVVEAPAGLPVPGLTHAVELRYRYGDGWKFACVTPPEVSAPIEGKPTRMGMWVYADGEGHTVRLRFRDSTGQTFQPDFGPASWKGWRFVTMFMDGRTAGHWGGANDGVIHYPIRWETALLYDSNKKNIDHDSRIYVTGFALE